MKENEFTAGKLEYRVAIVAPEELAVMLSEKWRDGFVAFAASEMRLADLQGTDFSIDFLTRRVQEIPIAGAEGYVNEINLWRRQGDSLEEIVAEREDTGFYVQHWKLDTRPRPGEENCWYRNASTKSGSHHKEDRRIFQGEMPTVEIVWPKHRLNFFISGGE